MVEVICINTEKRLLYLLIGPPLSGKEEYKQKLKNDNDNIDVIDKTDKRTFDYIASAIEDGGDVVYDGNGLVDKNFRKAMLDMVFSRIDRSDVNVVFVVFYRTRRKYWELAQGDKELNALIGKCLRRHSDVCDDEDFDEIIYVYS